MKKRINDSAAGKLHVSATRFAIVIGTVDENRTVR